MGIYLSKYENEEFTFVSWFSLSNLTAFCLSIISVTILKGRKMILIEFILALAFALNLLNVGIITSEHEADLKFNSMTYWITIVEVMITVTIYLFVFIGTAVDITKIEMLENKRNITGFIICFIYLLSLSC